jgi:hypothetical protein
MLYTQNFSALLPHRTPPPLPHHLCGSSSSTTLLLPSSSTVPPLLNHSQHALLPCLVSPKKLSPSSLPTALPLVLLLVSNHPCCRFLCSSLSGSLHRTFGPQCTSLSHPMTVSIWAPAPGLYHCHGQVPSSILLSNPSLPSDYAFPMVLSHLYQNPCCVC